MSLTLDPEKLQRALTLLHNDSAGAHLSGAFLQLHADAFVASVEQRSHSDLARYLGKVVSSIWDLGVVLYRFQRDLASVTSGDLPEVIWHQFAAADVDQFHVQLRSLFDYLARAMGSWAPRPGQSPKSFEELRNWLQRSNGNVARLGPETSALVQECDWFEDARRVRDSIVHQGAVTVVIRTPSGPAFQVHSRGGALLSIPALMASESFVRFDYYSAVLLGNVLAYLEDATSVARRHLDLPSYGSNARLMGLGFDLLRQWLENILVLVEHPEGSRDNV